MDEENLHLNAVCTRAPVSSTNAQTRTRRNVNVQRTIATPALVPSFLRVPDFQREDVDLCQFVLEVLTDLHDLGFRRKERERNIANLSLPVISTGRNPKNFTLIPQGRKRRRRGTFVTEYSGLGIAIVSMLKII